MDQYLSVQQSTKIWTEHFCASSVHCGLYCLVSLPGDKPPGTKLYQTVCLLLVPVVISLSHMLSLTCSLFLPFSAVASSSLPCCCSLLIQVVTISSSFYQHASLYSNASSTLLSLFSLIWAVTAWLLVCQSVPKPYWFGHWQVSISDLDFLNLGFKYL